MRDDLPLARPPAQARWLRVGLRVVAALLLIGGLTCGEAGLSAWREVAATREWPSVDGTIRGSEVVPFDLAAKRYRPMVVYAYQIGGVRYHGTRIHVRDATPGDEAAAREAIAAYPSGTAVRVYYDPNDPGRGVLDRSASVGTYVLLGAAAALLLGAMATWIAATKLTKVN